MLINKATELEENDLITFKLVTNDEIMARLVSQDENEYVISDPHYLIPNQNGMAIVPYIMTAEVTKPLRLKKSHVIFAVHTRKEIEPAFIKATTGIETPVNKIVKT